MRTQDSPEFESSRTLQPVVTSGDFSGVSHFYDNRPGYCHKVLKLLATHVGANDDPNFQIADVGAGTGKLSLDLCELGLTCTAVEPNAEMMQKGRENTANRSVTWQTGRGEETGLGKSSIDWLLMASSFHWVDLEQGLNEFYRVIRPGGFFTALWNPRNVSISELHRSIEETIVSIVPELKRISSGSGQYTQNLGEKLQRSRQFDSLLFVESEYTLDIPRDRYIGAWRSVNDIQSQAGPARFQRIMEAIEEKLEGLDTVAVPYKTRAWTVRRRCD